MINVGIAGIGFMGMIHYLAYEKVRGAKVAAVASRNRKKLSGDWRGIQGNFGPPGTKMDLSGIATYASIDDMLADPKIDVVDICLPPALHAKTAIAALKAGKHVLCEKPVALTVAEADRMVKAARTARRQLMIAHVLPFFPEYQFAYEAVSSGRYGRLLGGRFKRIISDPKWLPDFYDPRRVGGPVIDLHIHDAHFICLLCGMPQKVASQGRMRGEVAEFVDTQFTFDRSDLVVSAAGGVINQQSRAFTHAFEIHLERATLVYDFSVISGEPVLSMPLTVLPERGSKARRPRLGSGDPIDSFAAQLFEVARAVRTGKTSPILGGALARDALVLCHKQTQSVRRGRPVKV